MKLEIDTTNKTIQIYEKVTIKDLIEELMALNIGDDYTLTPNYPLYYYNGDNYKPSFPSWYTSSKI